MLISLHTAVFCILDVGSKTGIKTRRSRNELFDDYSTEWRSRRGMIWLQAIPIFALFYVCRTSKFESFLSGDNNCIFGAKAVIWIKTIS